MTVDTHTVELVDDETVENIARAALFAALVGAGAYITIPNPLSPAGITLQVLIVYLAGIMLGPIWGTIALVFYLAAGAVGAPIYIGGSAGIGHLLFSPTAGYLWSFPVAAFVIGYLTHQRLTPRPPASIPITRLVGAMVAGTIIIYAFGIVGMMLVLGVGLVTAFVTGAAAFIPFEAAKIAAAVGIVRSDIVTAK